MRANSHRFQKPGRNWKPDSEFQLQTAYSFCRKAYAFGSADAFLPAKQADSSSDLRLTSTRRPSQRIQSVPRPAGDVGLHLFARYLSNQSASLGISFPRSAQPWAAPFFTTSSQGTLASFSFSTLVSA